VKRFGLPPPAEPGKPVGFFSFSLGKRMGRQMAEQLGLPEKRERA